MAYGMQVWDAAGNLVLDISDSITRLLGVTTVSGNGSISDAGFATGRPFYYVTNSQIGGDGSSPSQVRVTFSGNTISWTAAASNRGSQSALLIYGVY